MSKFDEANAQVLGLSIDTMFALKTWAMAMGGIRHPLLADFWPHGGASKALGLFNEDTGFTNRAMIIIDPDGVVRHTERHTGTLPQADDALAKIAELQS